MQTKFPFSFIITIINLLFFHFGIILAGNVIGIKGVKALAEALKFNKNLTELNLSKFFLLFRQINALLLIRLEKFVIFNIKN